jgi:hypothetical protein
MATTKRDFINHPSKKTLILFTLLWFIGTVLLILSTTDVFSNSFFQKKYMMLYFLMICSTIMVIKLYLNYWKQKTS